MLPQVVRFTIQAPCRCGTTCTGVAIHTARSSKHGDAVRVTDEGVLRWLPCASCRRRPASDVDVVYVRPTEATLLNLGAGAA